MFWVFTPSSSVMSVLLYFSECWRVIKSDTGKIDVFQNSCLRRICRIFWLRKISYEELHKLTGCKFVSTEILQRRLRWLGHVITICSNGIPKIALHRTPDRKRRGEGQDHLTQNGSGWAGWRRHFVGWSTEKGEREKRLEIYCCSPTFHREWRGLSD